MWRRSYNTKPPALASDNLTHPINDPKYSGFNKTLLPSSESLDDVVRRLLPFWNKILLKKLKEGRKLLIVAHGNSLRAIYKIINDVSKDEILKFNIPTGIPLVFSFDKNLKLTDYRYIGDQDFIKQKINEVKNQTSSRANNL